MTRELNRRVAAAVCRHRHPLEWTSPLPRPEACPECAEILAVVLTELRKIVGRVVRIG